MFLLITDIIPIKLKELYQVFKRTCICKVGFLQGIFV